MDPYIGQILLVPFNFAPNGWAFCNGQLLPISQYTALFALLGTTYGGNGVSNFALPDLRGRVPVGFTQGPGLSNYVLGELGGAESVTLQVTQIPAHNHQLQAANVAATQPNPSGNVLASANAAGRPANVYSPALTSRRL